MKVTTTYEEDGFVSTFSGSFTVAEFLYHQNQVLQDPRLEKMKYKIVDFSEADLSKMDMSDAFFAVSAVHDKAKRMPGHDTAFVTRDPHIKGIINSFKREMNLLGVAWEMEIFATVDEARAWISARL